MNKNKLTGQKRRPDFDKYNNETFYYEDNNKEHNKNFNKYLNNKDTNIFMNKLVDECFNDFLIGNTNKLIEDYNLLKQKFYESI